MQNIKGIIWDLDGVLIDSEKHHRNAEIATLKEFDVDLSHDFIKAHMGCTLKAYMEAVVEPYNMDISAEELVDRHRIVLQKYYSEIFPMVPHADVVLEELRRNYAIGLATSAERSAAEGALNHFGLLKFFEEGVCGNEVVNGKPDPEIFLKCAEKLEISAGEAVVVEDAENGFRAAKDAGMMLIARRAVHNEHQSFSLADYVVDDLLDIPKILTKLS